MTAANQGFRGVPARNNQIIRALNSNSISTAAFWWLNQRLTTNLAPNSVRAVSARQRPAIFTHINARPGRATPSGPSGHLSYQGTVDGGKNAFPMLCISTQVRLFAPGPPLLHLLILPTYRGSASRVFLPARSRLQKRSSPQSVSRCSGLLTVQCSSRRGFILN